MTESVNFVADAAVIDRLGRELVSRQETALVELIKNAYDADATEVVVSLDQSESGRTLVVADNGTGMTAETLVNAFLRIASDDKAKHPLSQLYRRQRAGRKGIGRFATQRLGCLLRLRTSTDDTTPGNELTIDWRQFQHGVRLEDIAVSLAAIPVGKRGTTLRIETLRDSWTDAQIRRCWRAVLGLQQPFPIAPVASDPHGDPGFAVRFLRNGGLYENEELIADLDSEVLAHRHALIEMSVDDDGRASWSLVDNRFGSGRAWAPIHHEQGDDLRPKNYAALRNIRMRAYYFLLEAGLHAPMIFTRLRWPAPIGWSGLNVSGLSA